MQQTLIQATHLYRYFGTQQVVNDLSMTLQQGEVLGLLGPNGAGKSTTMQMLTGNLAPSQGEVLIAGIDLLEQPKQAKQHIGYLPENPPLYHDMTVLENLQYCAKLRGVAQPLQKKQIAIAIERCQLEKVTKRLVANLSKGYKQRVGIAQAILHQPSVIILDEPTSGLDPIQMTKIRHLIRELGNDHSVILSTHRLPEVKMICDKVQIIVEGKTVFKDTLQAMDQAGDQKIAVSFANKVLSLAAIENLDAVHSIESETDCQHTITVTGDMQAVMDKLCQLAVQEGWQMSSMNVVNQSLESIFLDLVHQDSGQPT